MEITELVALLASNKRVVGSVLVICAIIRCYTNMAHRRQQSASMKARAHRKRAQRDQRREELKQALAKEPTGSQDDQLVLRTGRELRDMMRKGAVSCEDVTLAFCRRALRCGESTNCVTEEFYDEALRTARSLDTRRREGATAGNKERLLEGVPISIKDQIHMSGSDSTCGFAARCFQPLKDDGLLVELLRDAGAIPFVKSNIPQGLLLPESDNEVWGQSKNPWDSSRTPGGSSGGSGGIVSFRAAPIGIGTDIGGSIRIPAHYCGVYGLKPTPGRITSMGMAVPRLQDKNGQNGIKSTAGPLANSVEDLALVMRALLVPKMWARDPTTPPIPFDRSVYEGTRKLRVGYFDCDGYFESAPACRRAVHDAVRVLREQGCEVVKFAPPPSFEKMVIEYCAILTADGHMRGLTDALEGETLSKSYQLAYNASNLPNCLRPTVGRLLTLLGEDRLGNVVRGTGPKSCHEFWQLIAEQKEYTKKFIAQWREAGIDALVCPGNALPALNHGYSKDLLASLGTGFLFNYLHFPAGIVPAAIVRSDETDYTAKVNDKWTRLAKEVCKNSEGLPVGVHVAALPYQDELCLRVMGMLEKGLDFKATPMDRES